MALIFVIFKTWDLTQREHFIYPFIKQNIYNHAFKLLY